MGLRPGSRLVLLRESMSVVSSSRFVFFDPMLPPVYSTAWTLFREYLPTQPSEDELIHRPL
jgi:hypothetical protein